jgi:DNA topoisomerase-2
VPALYRIIDEVLMNAVDNHHREGTGTDEIRVEIDRNQGYITIQNNGKSIPITIHEKEKVYVPELVFGNLLTGSNFDDTEMKFTGGRNGYGAKLANIFSTRFIVEIKDGQKHYTQEWTNNMSQCHTPVIKNTRSSQELIRVTLYPDFAKFDLTGFDSEFLSLVSRRIWDLAGCNDKLNVYLNGKKISITNFKAYVKHFEPEPVVYKKISPQFEIAIAPNDTFAHMTFVNSICTYSGGTHLNAVTYQIWKKLTEYIKKVENKNVSTTHIMNSMCVFLNCLIQNPTFDSQSKETLTTRIKDIAIENDLIKQIVASPIYDQIMANLTPVRPKRSPRTLNLPKLSDANLAGTAKSSECTLILTEGDSAKALAVSGLSVIGRDRWGVYPLRGKMLNVRDASLDQIEKNQEVMNVRKILGEGTPRYGRLLMMCDQDHDGSHIKGLILNMIDIYFPDMIREGRVEMFITPIIKASKRNETISFFTIPEYNNWLKTLPEGTHYTIKYYKGLGTNTAQEAKEYFSNLDKHRIQMVWQKGDENLLDMAFNKKNADMRKTWLSELKEGTYLDFSKKTVTISDFIDRELILFSHHDNLRSIPNLIDGLKPSQRKVLYSCLKRSRGGKSDEIKVAQLSGYVGEITSYHHGEASLHSTIINMAQDFVGSNNIPLLYPSGQFGTRLQGGKDCASARYIFTRLNAITRMIFHEVDDEILDYNVEENQVIEPKHYVPIIPMVLINGSEGMGTGWSTLIPTFDPLDVIDNILAYMDGKKMKEMMMWVRGFKGKIEFDGIRFTTRGIATQKGSNIIIEELPVGKWTDDYKEWLLANGKKFSEHHTDTSVRFEIKNETCDHDVVKNFKLETTVNTSNMILFLNNQLKRFDSPLDIIKAFYPVRLEFYEKRKKYLLNKLAAEIKLLENKRKFLQYITMKENLNEFTSKKKSELVTHLQKIGIESMDGTNTEKGYAFVLNLPIWNLTSDQIEKINKSCEERITEHQQLQKQEPRNMWREDLNKLRSYLVQLNRAYVQ